MLRLHACRRQIAVCLSCLPYVSITILPVITDSSEQRRSIWIKIIAQVVLFSTDNDVPSRLPSWGSFLLPVKYAHVTIMMVCWLKLTERKPRDGDWISRERSVVLVCVLISTPLRVGRIKGCQSCRFVPVCYITTWLQHCQIGLYFLFLVVSFIYERPVACDRDYLFAVKSRYGDNLFCKSMRCITVEDELLCRYGALPRVLSNAVYGTNILSLLNV